MRKFISNLSILSLLVGLAFILHSCGTDGEEVDLGSATFYADSNSGSSGGVITILITDKNANEKAEGQLLAYAQDPNCGKEIDGDKDVFTVNLPDGTYTVFAVEGDYNGIDGSWFNDQYGQDITINNGTCSRFYLGGGDFPKQPAQPNPVAGARFSKDHVFMLFKVTEN
ncbi:hypothetical protein KMW28_07505 [Flammeovirga yaeyamensis]|uniref:Lipoprotein n=1 Tax=Flammeovirga yaeyamensis TaxID=367791 RepID=A0AAX1N899_9BACT|nr:MULTISPECIES: hypothetical protein [Flammeovirga]ANQ49110.1 hypothetical protein MY04_1736 [Flammeovirga sp. MY04]MBB3698027.1 hypothetical protein [Flammeovirga yaeyamensis]NMF35621.1 hypothetical protein [Flammeovirga yaeyamensis]QWG03422.1 hypothetical protein KMW28_07505 [Flammeovirga yaeyamensis]